MPLTIGATPQSGHLLFVRQGTPLAQRFDPDPLELAGEPFPIAERLEAGAIPGIVAFSLSANGILAYGIGSAVAAAFQMVWVDRQGKPAETVGPAANYRGLDLAPDGNRVAAHRHDGEGGDIWSRNSRAVRRRVSPSMRRRTTRLRSGRRMAA